MLHKKNRIKNALNAKKGYDLLKEKYNVVPNNFHNKYVELPAEKKLLKGIKDKKVLDVGCGVGTHTKILAKKGAKVFGVDISKEMIRIAKENLPDVNFYLADMKKLPFKNNTFDVLFYGLCIHYEKKLGPVFKEANRVLKKGGKIIFTTHNPIGTGHVRVKIKGVKNIVLEDYFGHKENIMDLEGVNLKTYPRTISELFNPIIKNGFSISFIDEPKPSKNAPKKDRSYEKATRIPAFIIVEAKKL